MKTQAVLIATDPAYLGWLQDALGASFEIHWVRPDGEEPVLTQLERLGRLDVGFVDQDSEFPGVEMIETLVEDNPALPVIAIGSSGSAAVIDMMRAGARDFFVQGSDDGEVKPRLAKILRRSSSESAGQAKPGSIVSLHAVGGVGSLAWTTEHVALALQGLSTPGDRVLLLDAGTPSGATVVYLNLSQTYSLLDAVQDVYRCDQTLIDTAFTRHSSGLFVLSLPEDLVEPPTIAEDDFLNLLDVLVRYFSHIVVCASTNVPLTTQAGIIARAQSSVCVTNGTILNSRGSKHLLRRLKHEDCSLERMGLVVDRVGISAGLDAESLAQLIELPLWSEFQGQAAQRARAMNTGDTMFSLAPKDPYCRHVRALARRMAGLDGADGAHADDGASRPGFLARLLGE